MPEPPSKRLEDMSSSSSSSSGSSSGSSGSSSSSGGDSITQKDDRTDSLSNDSATSGQSYRSRNESSTSEVMIEARMVDNSADIAMNIAAPKFLQPWEKSPTSNSSGTSERIPFRKDRSTLQS